LHISLYCVLVLCSINIIFRTSLEAVETVRTWKVPKECPNSTLLARLSEVVEPFQQSVRRRWPFQQLFRKIQAMPSRRGNPSRLPALPALPEAAEGPKRGLVILLMYHFQLKVEAQRGH
jgi:hypothetical protein